MKQDIHPEYKDLTATCTCGHTFQLRSTMKSESLHVDVCSQCHPFYTGKQKQASTGGRVDKFKQRFASRIAR
ncbi:large subunit ribosomal protein L31 [Oceanospirillum multiglobuliferum]|uniref:Large ribosomal subunit protein bL31 n=1 Tax=Oceanospirillum multiglobuliferum TaxID=64969 RepID=A0A1T4S2M4_9GAMM|nr:50S ribosomal protein L31 [Oceanospirillum multiglobuliferum]OPX54493.1 50S ribosomal protein L31 [Oceanospirillum multiglobuliferum]SKA22539.1 large subunit ribosomal protein L31 [Oceanospirillum multiglobuliferum]